MKTLLQKQGDHYVLELDGKTVEEWMIDPSEPIEISVVDGFVMLAPMGATERREKIDAALDKLFNRYEGAFKRLAE